MIEVQQLTKQFGLTRALDSLSFSVNKGEILGFLGPNGAGKSTTMRILSGILAPTSGTASIFGIDITTDSYEARKLIGYLPESVPLYKDLIVRKYLEMVAVLKQVDAKDVKQQVDKVVSQCGLTSVEKRIIGNLSKGFKQRTGLAQALIGDPEVLILDEPTEGLDPRQIIEIRQLITDLAGNRTIILSSHILPEVSVVCQRVIIVNKGKLVAVDSTENLTHRLQKSTRLTIEVSGPINDITESVKKIDGVQNVEVSGSTDAGDSIICVDSLEDRDIRQLLSNEIVNKGWGLLGLKREIMSLEDIFMELVTKEDIEQ